MSDRLRRFTPFTRFVVGGAANTGATYGLFVLLSRWITPPAAYSAAYLTGVAIAYFVNTMFVFRVRPRAGSAARFPVVYLVSYLAGLGILTPLTRAGIDGRLAMAAVLAVNVPLTFAMTRLVLGKAGVPAPERTAAPPTPSANQPSLGK
ncbi:GtrA family protein [Streptosporangium sp. NPDC048047]|uniref:GtrA family protein n=1 Tax=Streptosporangium sp. NPDC048047 TaxID=3155748 RepID=UPI003431DE89